MVDDPEGIRDGADPSPDFGREVEWGVGVEVFLYDVYRDSLWEERVGTPSSNHLRRPSPVNRLWGPRLVLGVMFRTSRRSTSVL